MSAYLFLHTFAPPTTPEPTLFPNFDHTDGRGRRGRVVVFGTPRSAYLLSFFLSSGHHGDRGHRHHLSPLWPREEETLSER